MLKYLRIAVTGLSLTACVLLIALRVRSSYKPVLFYHFSDTRHVEVWSCEGKVLVKTGTFTTLLPVGDAVRRERDRNFKRTLMETELQHARESGACLIPDTNSFGFKWSNWNHFVMPYWFAIAITAVLAATPWIKWRFSLRTLLIATTLVAIVFGLIVYAVRPQRNIKDDGPVISLPSPAEWEAITGDKNTSPTH